MSEQSKQLYQFDAFRVDVAKRVLWRDGQQVPLSSKAFDLLLALLEQCGQVLEKDELMQRVWPDTVVEENNLTVNMSALRKALGERPNEHRYIVTIPGRGYRFAAVVSEAQSGGLIVERRTRSRVIIEEEESDEDETIKSIAVLPFKALGAEGHNEYLETGMADALITKFGYLGELIVRPTSAVLKYAANGRDPVEAGRELRVDAVLDGRVQLSGDQLRVTAQLIRVSDEAVIWAEKFDAQFTHIFAIQDSISEQVTRSLLLRLNSEQQRQLAKHYTADTEAYRLYLKGRYFTSRATKEGAQKGIEYFHQAIALDPHYALAYAGLADAYCWLSHLYARPKEVLEKARAAALKALELDEALDEAHVALGLVKMWYDWDWPEVEREFRRAIELNPSHAVAHQSLAFYLTVMERFDEGQAEFKRAQELDPLSLIIHLWAGWCLYFERRYDEAFAQFHQALELEPNSFMVYWGLGWTRIQQGDYRTAITELNRALALSGGGTEIIAALGHVYARLGEMTEARQRLDQLQQLATERYVSPFYLALVYIGLGETDQACAALDQACDDRFEWLAHCKVDPVWEPIHSDPRFQDVLRRVGVA